jgi:hypothetical protein
LTNDPEPEVSAAASRTAGAKLRLVLQRLASGFYNRPDVLRQVAARMIARGDLPVGKD